MFVSSYVYTIEKKNKKLYNNKIVLHPFENLKAKNQDSWKFHMIYSWSPWKFHVVFR